MYLHSTGQGLTLVQVLYSFKSNYIVAVFCQEILQWGQILMSHVFEVLCDTVTYLD